MRISDWSSYVCSSDLAPVVCVNISRRRAHAEDPAWREDRLDFETLDPGVASVLKRGTDAALEDRKSVVSGKSVSVRVDLGGRRIIKKKQTHREHALGIKT